MNKANEEAEIKINKHIEDIKALENHLRIEIQGQVAKLDEILSQQLKSIGVKVQTLTDKLLTPFITKKINMEVFFKVTAETVRQRETVGKQLEEKKQRF